MSANSFHNYHMNIPMKLYIILGMLVVLACSKQKGPGNDQTKSPGLPGTETEPIDSAKYVALFYFSGWGDTMYEEQTLSPSGDVWIIGGQTPANSPYAGSNFWGKPLWAATHGDKTIKNNYRFYFNNDSNQPNDSLLYWHADLISSAGVDFIVLDFTNGARDNGNGGPSYLSGTKALLNSWKKRRAQNLPTPKVCFFINNEETLTSVENNFLSKYPEDMFFNYLGKKLLLVSQPLPLNSHSGQPAVPTNGKYINYTARHCWGLDNTGSYWQFKVNSDSPPPPFQYNGIAEQMCAPVSTQATYLTTDGIHPEAGAQGRQNGAYFKKYMAAAKSAKVKFVLIHSWNEWGAQNLGTQDKPRFVDQWNAEYSSDIEPAAGELGDTYYQLMKAEIKKFRN